MVADGILDKHPDIKPDEGGSIELSLKERENGRENFDSFLFLIWPFIEGYWLAAVSLLSLIPRGAEEKGYPESKLPWFAAKDFEKHTQLLGKTLYAQGELSYLESINAATLSQAFTRMEEMGMILRKKSSHQKPVPIIRLFEGCASSVWLGWKRLSTCWILLFFACWLRFGSASKAALGRCCSEVGGAAFPPGFEALATFGQLCRESDSDLLLRHVFSARHPHPTQLSGGIPWLLFFCFATASARLPFRLTHAHFPPLVTHCFWTIEAASARSVLSIIKLSAHAFIKLVTAASVRFGQTNTASRSVATMASSSNSAPAASADKTGKHDDIAAARRFLEYVDASPTPLPRRRHYLGPP
ncbi:hypothetical protein L1887_60952 [Cichorium endivia]|nr:hypothetical protein L1887_60952 [Cichorium endivia]